MATPAFGFSFGDIVAAIKILNNVRKALRDTGGSKDEFQNIQVELRQLEILLEYLNNGTWGHGGDAGHLNAIRGMASTCQVPLQEFLTKIEKYKLLQAKEADGGSIRFRIEAKKIQWAIGMKEEIEKFRAIIVAKVVTITLLLQPHMIATISKIEAKSQAILDSSTVFQDQIKGCQGGINGIASDIRIANTERSALNGRIDRLVQICAGTNVGVEDFRRLSQARHRETNRHLKRLQQDRNRGFTIVISQIRVLSSSVGNLEELVRRLVALFGGFTSIVLKILKRTLKTDLEIYALLREIHTTILRQPFVAREDCILFTDALGRSLKLQYDFFKHWEVFESLLKCEFKQKPGEQRVIQGQYHLLRSSRTKDLIIDRNTWERAVFPGHTIIMSMIIVEQLFQQGLCPRPACGVQNPSPTDGSTLIICSACDLKYHCAEAIAPRLKVVTESSDGLRINFQQLGGQNMFRDSTAKQTRATAGASQPVALTDEFLIEEELEAFKAIHIQTRSRIENEGKIQESTDKDGKINQSLNHEIDYKYEAEGSQRDESVENDENEAQSSSLHQQTHVLTTPESRIGQSLGKTLRLSGILGTSASGVVYSAVDVATNMLYTVKALSKYNPKGEPLDERQRRFQTTEIQHLYSACSHPNVLSMLKIVDEQECVYVISEYYPDGDLFSNIAERGRYIGNNSSIRSTFLQIVDAVEHCHLLGIYHRDLKPENIVVNGDTVALADFGLATKSLYSEDHGCGSPFYMSPECLDQSPEAPSFRNDLNDIWSLGVILINLACGRNPWKKASLEDPTYKAFTSDHNFLQTILPLSDESNDILVRIFESKPANRISISELRHAIIQCSNFVVASFPFQVSDIPINYSSGSDFNEIESEAEYNSSWNSEKETSYIYD